MDQELEALRSEAGDAIDRAQSSSELQAIEVEWLGKKGRITELLKGLGKIPPEQRRSRGAQVNELKQAVDAHIFVRWEQIKAVELEQRLVQERIDVTLPVRPQAEGRIHPISQTIDEMVAIFGEMGFVVAEGPDVEDDFYNFTALNIPPEHPARQSHDTFYMQTPNGGGSPRCCARTRRRCKSAR